MNPVGPVGWWAVAALVGAALGVRVPLPPLVAASLAGSAVLLLVLSRRRPGRGSAVVAVLVVVVVAASLAAGREGLRRAGPLADLAAGGGAREVEAVVVTEPRDGPHGWWAIVRVTKVADATTRERAVLRGADDPPELRSVWRGEVTARPVGTGGYLADQHAAAELRTLAWERVAPPARGWRTTTWVRERVAAAASAHLPPAPAGLAAGLVTGDTRGLPPSDEQAMLDTGLSHLVAVSGSNVAMVAAGVVLLCSAAGIGAVGRRRAVVLALLWFAVLTRAEPSVLRATGMALLLLAASARGALSDVRHALAVAVLVLVLLDPRLAGSLGLLLSAAATVGVLVVAPLVRPRFRRLPRRVGDLLAVTVGAQVAVAPVLLWTWGELPLSSVPANLVAVPAAAIASALVATGALAALVHPVLAAPLLWLARPALELVLGAAHALRWRGGVLAVARPVTILAGLGAVAWLLSRPSTIRARATASITAVAIGVAGLPVVTGGFPVSWLTVTAIDVGQGDAILVESPGARVLVDGGPDDRAARWLRGRGRRRFDLVVLSHPHADHLAGLPAVLRQSRVGALWYREDAGEPSVGLEALRELAAARGTPIHQPVAGQRAAVGDLDIEVLGPPDGRPYRWTDSEANEASIVLRVRWHGYAVLLTGDAEAAAQRELLRRPDRLRADLLKVPHHGAATTDPAFLRAVGASDAVVPVGRGNRYGHPDAGILDVLAQLGTKIHRTDLEGTVRVEVGRGDPMAYGLVRAAPSLRSTHGPVRPPARRRRRPVAPPRARTGRRRAARRGSRPRRRDLRRDGDRAPPGAPHGFPVRWPDLRGRPWARGAPCGSQVGARAVPRSAVGGRRAVAGVPRRRQDPEDRTARG